MLLKDKITAEPGFQYVVDQMELMSSVGRRRMLYQPFLATPEAMDDEYGNVDAVVRCLDNASYDKAVTLIRHQFMQMPDLQGSLNNLRNHVRLEEIELFEIKILAFLCRQTARAAALIGIDAVLAIPDTDEVFRLLDPDNTGIATFYVYDSYHPDLAALRRQLKAMQTRMEQGTLPSDENAALQQQINDLFDQQNALQQQVIADLSDRLAPFFPLLQQALDSMAYADFLFAKATLARRWGLVRPVVKPFADGVASDLVALWNPRLKHRNDELGLRYQPVDVQLCQGTCLITGANMAGKTVLLKTVGIAQLMAQFGFFVPAARASIVPVDDIIFCIGDEQNEMKGLSSYASEIIKISDTISRSASQRLLILIDEPARTTNPVEGKAIVQSVATLLNGRTSFSIITTHYSQLGIPCRRLRVRGFVERIGDVRLTPDNINDFIDYSLMPDDSNEVPHEALRIASILGCDSQMLHLADRFLGEE